MTATVGSRDRRRPGKPGALVGEDVEADASSGLSLAEHTETAGEAVTDSQGVRVSGDGQTDRGGRGRVGRTVHSSPEEFAQPAGNDRQGRGATDEMDTGDVGVSAVEQGGQRIHGLDGAIDQRLARFGRLGDRNAKSRRVEVHEEVPRLGTQGFLGDSARLDEFVTIDRGVAEMTCGQISQHLVEVVATEVIETDGVEDFRALAGHVDQGCVEGATTEVIDDDPGALGIEVPGLTEGEFQPGRRRLVDEAEHINAGLTCSIHRHEALSGVSVGGYTEDGTMRSGDVDARDDMTQKVGPQIDQRDLHLPDVDQG